MRSVDEERVAATVERVRAAVLARHGYRPGDPLPPLETSPVEELNRLATVNAHWGIASDVPVVGSLLVLFRRVLRLTLRWYINPIVEQQNAFNQAVVRAVNDLTLENEELRARLAALQGAAGEERRGG